MAPDKRETIDVVDDDPELLGLVEDVMTRDVVTISDDEPLSYAARELERAGVSGAPVLREGRVVGIITLSDLLAHVGGRPAQVSTTGPFHRVEHLLADASPGAVVREAMTSPVRTVMVQDTLVEAARIMIEVGVNRLPVVDLRGSPCGIVTRDDVVAAVAGGHRRDPDERGSRLAPD